jgi:N-acetylmuramoyl-L-alanine amidase
MSVVVIDPAHGGADAGARGAGGIIEKDIVLPLARALRARLEGQGLQAVLTRQADVNPSYDERAALANSFRGAIFVSLHAGSTGTTATARTYYFPAETDEKAEIRPGVLFWDRAQLPFVPQSRRLAELVQVQIGQHLRGSVEVPEAAAVRPLRNVAAPAIAVELASVAVTDRKPLDSAVAPLADAIVRGVLAFKPLYTAGLN